MTLQQLNYVITVSETGSLNKASEILYVSQPSISGAIHDLESEIGIMIFHRSSRGVSLTTEGEEFLAYARQVYYHYESMMEKYGRAGTVKKKFGISTQHYSFAVRSFVDMVKNFDTEEYDFAIRETKTLEVIEDVASLKSELGIIYLSRFNKKVITKLLKTNGLSFTKLIDCGVYAYIWKGHPLAGKKSVDLSDLSSYPCLSFEQGGRGSLYFAEEVHCAKDYPRMIKVNDRATMLNLMIGLEGYTLCSGIISGELNGEDYIAVPFEAEDDADSDMEIGYIKRKDIIMSDMAKLYIEKMQEFLSNEKSDDADK